MVLADVTVSSPGAEIARLPGKPGMASSREGWAPCMGRRRSSAPSFKAWPCRPGSSTEHLFHLSGKTWPVSHSHTFSLLGCSNKPVSNMCGALWLGKALPSLSFLDWAAHTPGPCPGSVLRALFNFDIGFCLKIWEGDKLSNLTFLR